jgi:hypothetical protein
MKRESVSKSRTSKQTARTAKKRLLSPERLSDKSPNDEYRVGPGRPPRAFQFKPGQSGNPKGAKRKTPSIAPDLKELLERALNEKIELGRGEGKQIVTKAVAGIRKLVDAFARGDRSARRDLIALAKTLGVDLTMGHSKVIETALAEALTPNDEAILADHFRRHASRYMAGAKLGGDGLVQQENSGKAGHGVPEGSVQ